MASGDGARTLALRVAPVDGEALDSWVEECCRRHRVTPGSSTGISGSASWVDAIW